MDYTAIAQKIIDLKDADLAFRDELILNGKLNEGYHPKMEALHNRNAAQLKKIIDNIGYPTIDKVGKSASEAAWLIIQHAISQPDFMRYCARLLEEVDQRDSEYSINLAFLADRIAVFEGRPQRYGTQYDWDENMEMSPYSMDDEMKINQRRKSLGLNTVEQQTQIMRVRVKNENQTPALDLKIRKAEFEKWRRKVGWVK